VRGKLASQSLRLPEGLDRRLLLCPSLHVSVWKFIAPAAGTVRFASAPNHFVIGSMNDLVNAAQIWLTEGDLSPVDVGLKLNDMPMSSAHGEK
jgi:hypothetical protein